jgi:enoyl-CoA hydratase/carnithine racemase
MTGVHLRVADGVALLTIDRPETRNAVSSGVIARLGDLLDEVEAQGEAVRVFAIRGAGERVFVSGGDLKELSTLRTTDEAGSMASAMRTVLDRIARLAVPTVALVNGAAIGGGAEIAVACDMRLAVDTARIGFTQSQLGIMPAWGGIERLVSLVGRGRALYLLLSGQPVDAATALMMGLVEEIAPRERFDQRSRELLATIADVPTIPRLAMKALVDRVAPAVWPDTREMAIESFARSWVADEHWEAVVAASRARPAAADVAGG